MLIIGKLSLLVNKLTFLKTNAHLKFVLLPWLSFNNRKYFYRHRRSSNDALTFFVSVKTLEQFEKPPRPGRPRPVPAGAPRPPGSTTCRASPGASNWQSRCGPWSWPGSLLYREDYR